MHHKKILALIKQQAGEPTQHTFLDNYVGNSNPRYAISIPALRKLGKNWMKENDLSSKEFAQLIADLTKAPSSTEKTIAGLLLDYASDKQKKFNPGLHDQWLNHIQGWAEVDALCYGHFYDTEFIANWAAWKKLVLKLNKSSNINKRRASIVLLCKPLSQSSNKELLVLAFQCIDTLKHEKEILITKAISWTLRSMVKYYRKPLQEYLKENKDTLPKIAIRETLMKLKTGRKTNKKSVVTA